MPMFEKHFTIAEARSLLPELRNKFERIHSLYAELQELQDDYVKVQALIRANGHGPKDTGFESRAIELQTLVQEIIEQGIQIKDISRGLIDFPHLLEDGEEVFLCWELCDDGLNFWHRIEDGYAGREPL
jgi:hypothetical protein